MIYRGLLDGCSVERRHAGRNAGFRERAEEHRHERRVDEQSFTPAVSHVEISVHALNRNLPVLLEKPVAPSASSAAPLLAAALSSTVSTIRTWSCENRST
jgi:hypothetical protein